MKNKGGGLFWGKFLILGEGFVDTHHLLKRIFGDFDVEWRHEDYWFWDSLIDVGMVRFHDFWIGYTTTCNNGEKE